jgi:hypothetical protein
LFSSENPGDYLGDVEAKNIEAAEIVAARIVNLDDQLSAVLKRANWIFVSCEPR